MVLVDSSIWIRFLAGKTPFAGELERLLDLNQVAGHDLVYGELLSGERGGRRALLEAYERIPRAATVPHREVVGFVLKRNLQGRGVGWIDIHLLASALVERVALWTADSRLAAMAAELAVAYESS